MGNGKRKGEKGMNKYDRQMLNDARRLAQFKRAYVRACRGKGTWAKVLYLREYWKGLFMYEHLRVWYPVPSEVAI